MADEQTAQKAPESSTFQPSAVSSQDTPAQTGPSVGEHCVSDRPLPTDGQEPSGELTKLADTDVYIAKPSDYPHLPSKLLLLLSSGTGIKSKNNQLQADKYASEGFLVVMPDQFGGDPAPNTTDPNAATDQDPSIIEKVKLGVATTAKSFLVDMWLARHTSEKVLPILQKVIEGAKEEFADAVANGGGVYAAGYCFGGKYVCLLGSELPDTVAHGQGVKDEEQGLTKSGPVIKCGAFAHGTLVTQSDLEGVQVPTCILSVENDPVFPDEVRVAGEKALEEHKVDFQSKVFPGMPHGFAVVGDYRDAAVQEQQKIAFEQMVAWLKSH